MQAVEFFNQWGSVYGFFECSACAAEYELWLNIIEATGEAEYGDLALRGLMLEGRIIEFNYPITLLNPYDAALVEIVHTERNKLDAQEAYYRNKQAESSQAKK